jgi:hypothetical protein
MIVVADLARGDAGAVEDALEAAAGGWWRPSARMRQFTPVFPGGSPKPSREPTRPVRWMRQFIAGPRRPAARRRTPWPQPCPPVWHKIGPLGRTRGPGILPLATTPTTPSSTPPVSRTVVNLAPSVSRHVAKMSRGRRRRVLPCARARRVNCTEDQQDPETIKAQARDTTSDLGLHMQTG